MEGMDIINCTHLIDNIELERSIVQHTKILREDAHDAIGSVAVTLDYILNAEKTELQSSWAKESESDCYPFPKITANTYDTLLDAIVRTSGLSIRKATSVLDSLSNIISAGLKQAHEKHKILEVFPIGLYEYQEDKLYFSPHSVMLTKHYPNIHLYLKGLQ